MEKQIRYEYVDHLINRQAKSEQEMLEQFKVGTYTMEKPLVCVNPYLIAPLTAMILFRTCVPSEVTVIVHGKEKTGDIIHTFPKNTEHILPIYGLYADADNQVELCLDNGETNVIKIHTSPLDEQVPVPTKCISDKKYMRNNLMFLTQTSIARALACDYRGDVRWYLLINVCFDMKRLKNGHLLVGTDRLINLPYYVSGTYEMGVNGKIYREYRLPGGYHHDTFEMEDGNILMLTQEAGADTVEDMLALVDRETGKIIRTWDYKKVLPYQVASTYSGSGSSHDWFHNNAVWYDKCTNSITLSGRHQDAVINLNFETGALNWIIGCPDGWPEEYKKFFFTPEGEEFEWSWEQHGCVVCPDGDIMMFDNGHYRSKIKEQYAKATESYSRGVRYHIDKEKHTIRQVWQYGKERGADFYSPYICNVEYFSEGHYLVHSGGIAYMDGKPSEELGSVEAVGANRDKCVLNSITCEIVNNEVVYELHVPSNVFRAEKLPAYYCGEVAELGAGKILGEMAETQQFLTEIPAEDTGMLVPDHYGAYIQEEADRIKFNATFEKGELAMLLLEKDEGEVRRYYINTSASKNFEAMCDGSFLKTDPRNVDLFVNKKGLTGTYQVFLVCGNQKYRTGVSIQGE